MSNIVSNEAIQNMIFIIRGKKVMLDIDLADLYRVGTKSLNQAVRRNIKRFPDDFMFKLNEKEFEKLRSQFVTAKYSMRRFRPYVFTEQGVAMLSSVLNSDRAVQINIQIMRIFVRIREMLSAHKELAHKLDQLEEKVSCHDVDIRQIFNAIRQLMKPPRENRKKIGFEVKGLRDQG